MKKIIFGLLLVSSFSSLAASYTLKLSNGKELEDGSYFAQVRSADDRDLDGMVKIYPASKDAYYNMKNMKKGDLLRVQGTNKGPGIREVYDTVNAIVVEKMPEVPVGPIGGNPNRGRHNGPGNSRDSRRPRN